MRDFWRGQARVSRLRVPLHRLGRPLRAGRPPAVGVDQLRHRARRLHARRPRLVQREAQRGEPRGEPRRHRRQPQLELRRRGPDRRRRRSTRCASGSSGTSSRRCSSRRACRCCSPATSSAARRTATTTPTARTTRSRGSTGSADERSERLLDVHAAADRAAARAPGVPAHDLPRRRARRARRCPTSWWFRPDGRKMTRKNWEQGGSPCVGVFLNGEALRTLHRARRAGRRRLVPDPLQRAPRAVRVHAAAAPLRPLWEVELSTADPDAPADRHEARTSVTVESRSLLLLQRA